MKENPIFLKILELLNDPKKFLFISLIPLVLFLMVLPAGANKKTTQSTPSSSATQLEEKPKKEVEKSNVQQVIPQEEKKTYPTHLSYDLFGTVNEKQGLKLRAAPSTESEQLDLIEFNQKVEILDAVSGPIETLYNKTSRWLKVSYNGKTGWAFGGFLNRESPKFNKWKIVSYTASNSLSEVNSAKFAFDGNPRTSWGAKGNGKEWLEASLETEKVITKLVVINGFAGNPKTYSENNRFKEMLVECMDGNRASVKANLYDLPQPQDIYLPVHFECKTLRFSAEAQYLGTSTDPNLYISSIEIFGK